MPISSDGDKDEYDEDKYKDEDEDVDNIQREDEEQENEDSSSVPLHPTVLPWLKKKLKTLNLGPYTNLVIQRHLAQRYNLDASIESLDGHEQEQLLEDVQQFRRIEKAARSHSSHSKSSSEAEITAGSESGIVAGISSKPPPSRAGEREAVNLLTRQEQEAAKAVSLYWSALVTSLPEVKRWKAQVLRGKRLTTSQADAFISSAATRFLTVEDWQKHGVSAVDLSARILNWELDYVDQEELLPERRAQACVLSSADNQGYFNSYRVTLELRTPHPAELIRELLGGEDALLWIPFLALPSASDPADETYPRMFPGSVADELGRLGEKLSRGCPFQPWQVAWLILTDEAPQVLPVRVTSLMPSLKAAQKAGTTPEHAFRARIAAGSSPDGYIRIEAFPWVSAKTIQCYYSHYQKPMIARKPVIRKPPVKPINASLITGQDAADHSVAGPLKQHLPALHLLQAIQEMARQQQQGTSLTWKALHQNQRVHNQPRQDQNNQQGQNSKQDYSSFVKGCKAAWTMLNLPWNLKQIIQKNGEPKKTENPKTAEAPQKRV